eukprot:1966383-Rhodomonas_salina.5
MGEGCDVPMNAEEESLSGTHTRLSVMRTPSVPSFAHCLQCPTHTVPVPIHTTALVSYSPPYNLTHPAVPSYADRPSVLTPPSITCVGTLCAHQYHYSVSRYGLERMGLRVALYGPTYRATGWNVWA